MQLIWEYGDIMSVLDEDNLVFVPASYLARCETTPNKSWVAVWYPGETPCLELRYTTELDMGREYDFRHETGRHEGKSDAPRLAVLFAGKEHYAL